MSTSGQVTAQDSACTLVCRLDGHSRHGTKHQPLASTLQALRHPYSTHRRRFERQQLAGRAPESAAGLAVCPCSK